MIYENTFHISGRLLDGLEAITKIPSLTALKAHPGPLGPHIETLGKPVLARGYYDITT